MKINLLFGTHAQHVKREAQRKVADHIKSRIPEMKDVVGQ